MLTVVPKKITTHLLFSTSNFTCINVLKTNLVNFNQKKFAISLPIFLIKVIHIIQIKIQKFKLRLIYSFNKDINDIL